MSNTIAIKPNSSHAQAGMASQSTTYHKAPQDDWGIPLSKMLLANLCTVPDLLKKRAVNLRLRTKLLLSLVLLTSTLSCATLLVVRHNAQTRAHQEIDKEARNAALTFQLVQRQVRLMLSRTADLLASLAFMRNGDATAVEDAGNDPWQSDECNLFVLADRRGKLLALHARGVTLRDDDAQRMLSSSVGRSETSGWWFAGNNLYQVVMQPFYAGAEKEGSPEGYVVVGRLIDVHAVRDLGNLSSSDVVFRYGDDVAVSTLNPIKASEFEKRTKNGKELTELSLDGEHFAVRTLELTPGAHPSTTLTVLKSYNELTANLRSLNHLLLGLGLATLLFGSALIFIISYTITEPLGALVNGVKALKQGNFAYPLKAVGDSDVSHVTRAFVDMRETLQRNEAQKEQLEGQLRQAQKMEALGRLAGGVAHDFNNLLTVIRGHGELLLDDRKDRESSWRSAELICKTADRASSLTRQLLAFSRKQVLKAKVVDVNELVTDMDRLLRRLLREDVELDLHLAESAGRVRADPGQLQQVVLNLVVNASDAMPQGGRLTIATENVIVDQNHRECRPSVEIGNYVLLSVSDTGLGMDAATKAHIFEPFFTTKEPGKGTGLGLATVYGVVKQSGGFIWVESALGCGARFEIYLPLTAETVEAACNTEGKESTASNIRRKTVLVVEDNSEVLDLASEFLTAAGYRVLTAENGCEGLEIVKRLRGCVELVLTDVVMPRMGGPELGRELEIVSPGVKTVYMTGYLDGNMDELKTLGDVTILQKPFSRESLLRCVKQASTRIDKPSSYNLKSKIEKGNFQRCVASAVPSPGVFELDPFTLWR